MHSINQLFLNLSNVVLDYMLSRQGNATEGAAACLQYGFSKLGFHDVYSFTADVNKPSKKVMMKIGMSFIKMFSHPKVEKDSPLNKHVLFHIKQK